MVADNRNQKSIRERGTYLSWRQQQVLVTQEAFVETSTVKSNIVLQGQDQSDSRLLQSIYDAAMTEDLEQFENGVHQPLGETGINLSGGQKQRLNLARALFTDRRYLLLDDPMSAVDEAVADHLWQQLLNRGHGFIIATHRMKYVEECDQVIVMKNGEITEIGSPKDLERQKKSHFVRLQQLSNLEGI